VIYPKRRRVWPYATVALFLVACLIGVAAIGSSSDQPRRDVRPAAPKTTLPAKSAPASDLGTPGGACATNRLGKRFTHGGVTYVCAGPKPYRWRAEPKPAARAAQPPAVSYRNCTQMRRDHPGGVPKGHPAYRSGLDRDRDGRACER
jgi:hypothetical protein